MGEHDESASDAQLSAIAQAQFSMPAPEVLRVPCQYWGAPEGTPAGVVRPALVWPQFVLSVVYGVEAPTTHGRIEFQLAVLCGRCHTVFVAPSTCPGFEWVNSKAELDAALEPGYGRFVDTCVQCESPASHLPPEGTRPCRTGDHRYTAAVPGPVNEGDQRWCTECGYLDVSTDYRKFGVVAMVPGQGERLLPAYFNLGGGGGGGG